MRTVSGAHADSRSVCARALVHPYVCGCVCMSVCVGARVRVCMRERVRACRGACLLPHVHGYAVTAYTHVHMCVSRHEPCLPLRHRHRDAADEELVRGILAVAQQERALDAIASILFAPRAAVTFDAAASALRAPTAMIYGREDPWVVPLWGQRLKRALPTATYFEVGQVSCWVPCSGEVGLYRCWLHEGPYLAFEFCV